MVPVSGWEETRWWRVVRDVPNPGRRDIYSESSDEEAEREALAKCPWKHARLERLWERTEREWRPA